MTVSTTVFIRAYPDKIHWLLPVVRLWILGGLLTGCASTPNPFAAAAGAPVSDRPAPAAALTSAVPPPAPAVEVQPLQRPATLEPQPVVIAPPKPRPPRNPPPRPPRPATATPARPAPEAPLVKPPQGNQAVATLLKEAESHVSTSNWEKAEASLERAIRLEPRNATIWHDLAQIRLQKRDFAAAESTASKSNNLAGNNNALKARNWRLIAFARRARGDIAGAEAAEAKATAP